MKNEQLKMFLRGLMYGPYQSHDRRKSREILQAFIQVYGHPSAEYLQPGRGYLAYLKEAQKAPLVIRLDIARAYDSVPRDFLIQLFGEKFLDIFSEKSEIETFIDMWCLNEVTGGLQKGLAHSGWVFSQCMNYTFDIELRNAVWNIYEEYSDTLPKLNRVSYSRYADEFTLGLYLEDACTLPASVMKEMGQFIATELHGFQAEHLAKYKKYFAWNESKTRVGCPGHEMVWYSHALGIGPKGVAIPRDWLKQIYRSTDRLLSKGYRIDFWVDDPEICPDWQRELFPYRPLRSITTKLMRHDPLRSDIARLQGYHDLIRQVYGKHPDPNREVLRLRPLMAEFRKIRKKIL